MSKFNTPLGEMTDMEPEFVDIVNEHFWEMIGDKTMNIKCPTCKGTGNTVYEDSEGHGIHTCSTCMGARVLDLDKFRDESWQPNWHQRKLNILCDEIEHRDKAMVELAKMKWGRDCPMYGYDEYPHNKCELSEFEHLNAHALCITARIEWALQKAREG